MAQKLLKIIADFATVLVNKVAVGATTATLQSATDGDGVALPNGTYSFTIDRKNSKKEHFQADLVGTALTNVKTIARGTGIATSGFVRSHRANAEIVITDFAALKRINDILDGTTQLDAATPLAYDSVADMTGNDNKLATVAYVKSVTTAGAPDAGSSTKGITKLSVAPVSGTNPIAVGDNDTRVPTQNENDALLGDIGSPSTSNKFLTQQSLPAGSLVMYGGSAAPTGWLLCDGAAVSRITYSNLFAILSTAYGTGDGSTTFNLPDMRGRVPLGTGTGTGGGSTGTGAPTGGSALTTVSRGSWKGEETHTMTVGELVAHTHQVSATNGSNFGGAGTFPTGSTAGAITSGSTGSTTPFNVIQPVMGLNFIIKI